ncbi:TonB-dependent receptor plug domain-containing protein [Terricaulis sp.]|uniref:TonB-dependent receptor plug domain-containing protein n=1 Tax=Terricaulis sp. TaxID=2768686 RepID=UPI003783AC28
MARGWCVGTALAGVWLGMSSPAWAQEQQAIEDLRPLSIEQLSGIEVTSVSRRGEPLSEAPAAIDVITAEEIGESGAQSLPEVLRLARNLEVARVRSQHYAISARGFNTFQASNKLLVLIDGRSVYTPLYSGVLWDQHDVVLDDIERIEVISGPGGTLWGANAVNGVINIITRSAADTRGGLLHAQLGSLDQRVDVRYGGVLGERASFRVFATAFGRGALLNSSGEDAGDGWSLGNVGFRSDWGDLRDQMMIQGALHERLDDENENSGGHLLGHWRRLLDDGSSVEVQSYYASASAREGLVSDSLDTWDIEAQHTFLMGPHQFVWGGGYRWSESEFVNASSAATLVPARRSLDTANLFLQDQIALRDDLALTFGVKVENHTYTGVEYLPNVRLAWRPNDTSLVWAAVSRAVRTPSRIDRDLRIPGVILDGNMQSEDLIAYELGYRSQLTDRLSFSVNLFFNDYDGIRTLDLTPPGALPVEYSNGMDGQTYGVEFWADAAVTEDWRVSAGFTLLEQEFDLGPLSIDFNGSGDDPGYQVFLRSQLDIAPRWRLGLDLRAIDAVSPQVPDYVELNARLGWRVTDAVEIALAGQNLFDEAHPESFDEGDLFQARRSITVSARLTY